MRDDLTFVDAATDTARAEATAAARLFGLDPLHIEVQLSEATIVARVLTGDDDIALKIFDADADDALLRWRHEVAAHAAASGSPVPQPRRTPAGDLTAAVSLRGRPTLIQASAWSGGVSLAQTPLDPALLHEVGGAAARLSRVLDSAPPPPAHEPHLWDLRRSGVTLTDALARAADPEVRITGLRALRAFHGVERVLSSLPVVVVHQDLHDDNLLIAEIDGRRRVAGILDFGDATLGPRVADLVIPAAYSSRHADDPLAAVEAVVDGWGAVLPLGHEERSLILPLAAVRLATNAAVWHARSHGPRAAYAAARSRGSLTAAAALLDALE